MLALVPDLVSKLLCFACSRGHRKVVSITTLIVVSAPLELVAALSIVAVSCHLGGAELVPRRFKLLFRVLVAKDRNVSDFLFRVLVTMSSRFALFKLQNLLLLLSSKPLRSYNDHYVLAL